MVEDQVADVVVLTRHLLRGGFQFSAQRADAETAFRRALDEFKPNLILSDSSIPGFDGSALFC